MSEFEWQLVGNILARSYEEIRPIVFPYLAERLAMLEELSNQERFLNLFLSPIKLSPGTLNPFNVRAYTVDPRKIAGVKRYVNGGISGLMLMQTQFSTSGKCSGKYIALQTERDRLKRISALLTATTMVGMVLGTGMQSAEFLQITLQQQCKTMRRSWRMKGISFPVQLITY